MGHWINVGSEYFLKRCWSLIKQMICVISCLNFAILAKDVVIGNQTRFNVLLDAFYVVCWAYLLKYHLAGASMPFHL